MKKIIRTFHPVGQGAFYSERHPNFNIVYDCGSLTAGKTKEKVVHQSFSKKETIDVLFISHFDADHVNLIKKLKDSVKEIKYVVMPLLDTNKECLAKLYNIIYPNYPMAIIENPAEFFHDSNVVYVRTTDNFERAFENSNTTSIEELNGNSQIDSGQTIVSNQIPDWGFIPANYKFQERTQSVNDALKNAGIYFDKIQTDVDYLREHEEEIRNVFKNKHLKNKDVIKIPGSINENSMVLYSGPTQHCDNYELIRHYSCHNQHCCYMCHRCHINYHRPACVYTGDANLNKLKISQVFNPLWKYVGTIQVPHHGSKENFDFSMLNGSSYICPVSFGTNNQFGHPSTKVMSSILANDCCPIQVTEDMNTAYYQIMKQL